MSYLIFESFTPWRKRPAWRVKNKKKDILGYIKWDRKYFIFTPHFSILGEYETYTEFSHPVFSHECLDELSRFLKKIEHLGKIPTKEAFK